MGFPATTITGETVVIERKEGIDGESELYHAEDGSVYTRNLDAPHTLIPVTGEAEAEAAPVTEEPVAEVDEDAEGETEAEDEAE